MSGEKKKLARSTHILQWLLTNIAYPTRHVQLTFNTRNIKDE